MPMLWTLWLQVVSAVSYLYDLPMILKTFETKEAVQ